MSSKEWVCKKHKVKHHDVFINYRVKTEHDLAEKLFLALSLETKADGKHVVPFLDAVCLNDGEDWEVGFLNGLENAALLILLISEDAIEGIRGADKRQDNVLLEYEYALAKHDSKKAMILPLLIGKSVDGGLYKPFGGWDTSVYPDSKHLSDRSTKKVRETMQPLFKLQGLKTDPGSYKDKMSDILSKTEEALTSLGRLTKEKDKKEESVSPTQQVTPTFGSPMGVSAMGGFGSPMTMGMGTGAFGGGMPAFGGTGMGTGAFGGGGMPAFGGTGFGAMPTGGFGTGGFGTGGFGTGTPSTGQSTKPPTFPTFPF